MPSDIGLLDISEPPTNERDFLLRGQVKRTLNTRLQVAVRDSLTARPGSAAHKSVTGSAGPVVQR